MADAWKMHDACERQSALLEADRRRTLSEVPVFCKSESLGGIRLVLRAGLVSAAGGMTAPSPCCAHRAQRFESCVGRDWHAQFWRQASDLPLLMAKFFA